MVAEFSAESFVAVTKKIKNYWKVLLVKICKKFLAVLLSILMIASVIVVPAYAEETTEPAAENYVSLLDMSGLRAGVFTQDDNTAFPAGLADLGVYRGPYNGCGSAYYSGKQEIIELEDGSNAWKINFNKAMTGGGWYNDNKGLFVANVAIPKNMAPYITSIKLDIINGANGSLQYQAGVVSGSYLAKTMKESYVSNATPDAPVELNLTYDITTLEKRGAYEAFNGGGTVVGKIDPDVDPISAIYFSLKDAEAADGGLGYAIIKDIGVTLSVPEEDLPVDKEYSIFDLSEATVGATNTGNTDIIADVAAIGVSQFSSGWKANHAYNGTQEIVEVDGKKAWKINWDIAMNPNANLCDVGNEFMVKLPIPAKFAKYVTGVKAEITNVAATQTGVAFGFYDGSNVSWKSGNNSYDQTIKSDVTDVVLERNIVDLKVRDSLYAACPTLTERWEVGSASSVYLVMVSQGCNGTEGGYAIIKDIKITVSAPQNFHDNLPIEKEVSIFDLSEAMVGETVTGDDSLVPAGANLSRWNFGGCDTSFHAGTQEIVEVNGKKALKVYFDVAGKQNGHMWGSTGVYSIKIPVPGSYAPYVTDVNLNLTTATVGNTAYRFGVTDGSKIAVNERGGFASITTGQTITVSRNTLSLGTVGSPYAAFHNGTIEGGWGDLDYTMTDIFFVVTDQGAVDGGKGYIIINDVTVKMSASQKQWDGMAKDYKASIWDLSDNEIGAIANADIIYPKGVNVSGYSGALEIANDAKYDKKVLRFDLTNTAFSATGDRLNENNLSPRYNAVLNIIPSTYAKYVTGIKLIVNKQSSSKVLYNFGVSDGSNYSKLGEGANSAFAANKNGYEIISLNPANLYKCSSYYAGAYSDPRKGAKWNDGAFTALFLRMSANTGAEGYIDIIDIQYSYTMSDAQKAEADAQWASMKSLVNDFEGSGSESSFATSGTKVQSVWSGNGYSGSTISLNSNIYLDEAKGFTFWMYNPNASAQSPKLWLNTKSGTRYIINTGYSIAANSYAKVTVDFSKVYEWAGDNGGYSKGNLISLTKEQIAEITNVQIMIRPASTSILVDDVYLFFDPIISEKPGAEITFGADNVTGGIVTEDGKIEIPVTAEDQVVAIKVPKGTFTEAGVLTYKLSSTANAAIPLKFYMGTVLDNGKSGYIKIGQNPWSYSIGAATAGEDGAVVPAAKNQEFNFYATRELRPFEGSWYVNNWMGDGATHPTASAKANIDTIYLGVKGVADATGSIFIEGFDLVNVGVKIKADANENGTVTIIDDKVFVGDKANFIITPETGYYLKSLTVVDSLGNELEYSHSNSSGAENLGLYYEFTVTAADAIIKPNFAVIGGTMPMIPAYDGDNLILNYSIPFVANKVYNESTYEFETLGDYGIIIASDVALEKYGYTVEDLTPEKVDEIIASGHHLANYIYKLDGKKAIKTENSADNIRFTVEITDITTRARRAPFALAAYADFKNAEGEESKPVNAFNYNTMDMLVYGNNLAEEFNAINGINYCGSLTADFSVWEDIYNQGFDHIRLPLTMNDKMDAEYNLIEEKMADVDYAIENALRAGFSIVVDTHSLGVNISGDYENSVTAYYKVWSQLSERYKNLPLSVAFQFVNEPMTNRKTTTNEDGSVSDPDPLTETELMTFQEKLVKDCRAVAGNEDRYMVISNHNNGGWAFAQFTDSILSLGNIVIDIHYYNPMSFTHSGSDSWEGNRENGSGYPSGATEYSKTDIVNFANKCAIFAETNGVIVWVGEWGAYQPNYTAKIAYYADVAKALADSDVPWSLWEYGSGFSPYKNGAWDQELLDALFYYDGVDNTPATE